MKLPFILAFEPTYEGIGAVIRNEIIKKGTGRSYSAATTAQAYALDREVLYRTTVLPALKKQKFVVQDRGLPASLAYQSAQAEISKEKLTVEDILALPGNCSHHEYDKFEHPVLGLRHFTSSILFEE